MRAFDSRIALLGAGALVAGLAAASCTVSFPNDTEFGCATPADCLEAGSLCLPTPNGGLGRCCLPQSEICDNADNDCDGQTDEGISEVACYAGPPGTAGIGACRAGVQICQQGQTSPCFGEVGPATETCNGHDDDCDGQIDEDFSLQTDVNHCGNCITVCSSGFWCEAGKCIKPKEDCTDGVDNDKDGDTDCADADCASKRCKAAPSVFTCDSNEQCSCAGVLTPPAESNCSDHADNDCDGLVDCADESCNTQSCGPGCACQDPLATETDCADKYSNGVAIDNDADGKSNCADDDCESKSCNTQQGGCVCAAGALKETGCSDTIDNDGDKLKDCVDPDCANQPCKLGDAGWGTCQNFTCKPAPDGGTGADAGAKDAGALDAGQADAGPKDGGDAG